jgi:hypothetical protein
MFGFLNEIIKGVGKLTGSILAIPLAVVAEALEMTVDMVKEAKDAGCETYEEIRKYWGRD